MASSPKVFSAVVSVGLHGLVLGWTVRAIAPNVDVARDDDVLAMITIVDVPDAPVREAAQTRTPRAAPVHTAAAVPVMPTPTPEPEPRRRRATSKPDPAPPPSPVPLDDDDADTPMPDGSGSDDDTTEGDTTEADAGRGDAPSPSGDGGFGTAPHGDGDGRGPSGRDEADYSAYGARIVALVMAELDRSPVPGIGPRDTIQLVLEVLPDGTLARTGYGRFDVARVTRTSLGRLRMRQILKRVERASARFPDHPAGFAKSRFVVDVTVNFRPRA